MKLTDKFSRLRQPTLTQKRIWFAVAVALLTDVVQFGLGPLGWVFADEGLDVMAMILISWALGFHMLLLPTFLVEFIPGPDMLPTWTGCTAVVIMLRKKAQAQQPLDIQSQVTSIDVPPKVETGPDTFPKPPMQRALGNNARSL